MANKATFLIEIDGTNVKAVKAIDGTEQKMKSFDSKVSGFGSSMNNIMGSVSARVALGATAAVAGLGLMIKSAIDTADNFDKMSQRTGVSAESLSTLAFAANLSGTSIEAFETSVIRLSRNVADMERGTGEARYAFEQLGIETKDSGGKLLSTEQILFKVADKFEEMPDGINKTAAATQLFGRSGAQLIPMLNEGSKGLNKLQQEARNLGLEISSNTARNAAEFNDNLDRLKSVGTGIATTIASELLPALAELTGSMNILAQDTQTVSTVGQGLGMILKILVTVIGGVATGALVAGQALGTVGAIAAKIITLDFKGAVTSFTLGFEQIKKTSLSTGDAFDALWGSTKKYEDILKKLAERSALEEEENRIKKIRDQWEGVAQTLQNEILLMGLDPQSRKLAELYIKADDLKKKYKEIGESVGVINKHLEKQLATIFDITTIQVRPPVEPVIDTTTPLQIFDINQIQTAKDTMRNVAADISTESMMHFTMMQDGVSDIFGNMSGAALNAYQSMAEGNSTFFAVYKAMAIAQASIDTYQSAVAAYKAMVGIPVVGPTLAVVAAAAATAFGLSNIARIASMQPGSRSGGSSGARGSASIPSTRALSQNNSTTNTRTYAPNITIQINSEVLAGDGLDKWVRDNLSSSIKKAVNDGSIDFGGGN